MFLDKVKIQIKAGNGGNGHVSFYRDRMTMTGGPDGGDGGRGGNIVFVGTTREDNLINFRFTKKFFAGDGKPGGKNNRSGPSADDLYIPVPLGTRIYKEEQGGGREEKTGPLLADITQDGQTYVALRGGGGGKGNAFYATSRKQTPNFSQTGLITKEHSVILELHTLADIGLVGFPNVGKSTLLAAVTRANPKIANYHFTTLHPNIGVVNVHGQNLVIADIPGLIQGASEGVGLGHDFLRHVNRTRLLIHVVDISQQEGRDAQEDFLIINNELAKFSGDLAKRPMIIALNKCDIAESKTIQSFRKKFEKRYEIFEISAATGKGVAELMAGAAKVASALERFVEAAPTAVLEEAVDKSAFTIEMIGPEYFVTGPLVDNMIRGVVLTDTESNAWFQRRLIESGIIAELKNRGLAHGDTVHVGSVEFEFVE